MKIKCISCSRDDSELTAYLWAIVREMIKTVIENKQNLIIEGRNHFADIKRYLEIQLHWRNLIRLKN